MKKFYTLIALALLCNVQLATAQNVGIGTNNPLGKLDIVSSDEGLVIPRVTLSGTSDATTVLTLQNGELVYNTATAGSGSTAVTPGFYHWNGSSWGRLALDGPDDDQDWFEQGTTTSPDNINDNIFTHGNVGIGAAAPADKLHVSGGDIRLENGYELYFSDNGQIRSYDNNHRIVFNRSGNKMELYEFGDIALMAGNNVGIGITAPTHKLHVVGDIWAQGKYVVQNGQDGGTNRGIYLWNAADANWGIYMGTSGSAKSLSGGVATAGSGFTSHSVRFRANNNSTQGFIFENSSEVNLFSIRGSDGLSYFAGSVGIGTSPSAKFHVNGSVRLQGISEGAGKVLVSDASGNATWSNDLPDNDVGYIWNQNGSDQSANYRITGTGQQSQVIATANGDWFMRGGDDTELRDVNIPNYLGVWGRQNSDRAGLQLGSDGSYIFGDNGNIGIGTAGPSQKLDVAGIIRSTDGHYINYNNPTVYFQDTDHRSGMIHVNGNLMYILNGSANNSLTWTQNGSYWPMTVNLVDDVFTFGGEINFMEGNVGISTTTPGYPLTIGNTGAVFGVENTANFMAKNSSGTYETYFWPRWSDNVMYMNYGSGGFRLRNSASQDAIVIDNDRSVNIAKGVLFDCNDCGATNTIDGTGNYGDLVIQGRVFSTNGNMHLSPPSGNHVIINSAYRAAGGSTGSNVDVNIEDGGLHSRRSVYYYKRYRSNGTAGTDALGYWDYCALGGFTFNNDDDWGDDTDIQCNVYNDNQAGGAGQNSSLADQDNYNWNQQPYWRFYTEAYGDTEPEVTCTAMCITFDY